MPEHVPLSFASESLTATAQRVLAAIDAIPPGRGALFVATGSDGAGKTELADEVTRHLQQWTIARSTGLPWQVDADHWLITNLRRQVGGSDLRSMVDRAGAPTALIVDDAHWADATSLRKLVELATSMTVGRLAVLMLVSEGEDGAGQPSMSQLRSLASETFGLAPFTVEDIRAFALSHAGIPLGPHTAQSIQLISGGRPGQVREVLDTVPREHWFADHPTVPVPKVWLTAFDQRVTDPKVLPALQAASIAPPDYHNPPALVLHLLGGNTASLEAAFDAKVLRRRTTNNDESIVFFNPTDRAVIQARMTPMRHVELHRHAAQFYRQHDNETMALLYTARSSIGSNDEVADALAERGVANGAEGRWPTAAENLFHAARITSSTSLRSQRQLASIEAMLSASNNPLARQYAEAFIGDSGTPSVDAVLGYMALQEGRRTEATEYLDRAWKRLSPTDDSDLRSRIATRHMLLAVAEWNPEHINHWLREATHAGRHLSPYRGETVAFAQFAQAATAHLPQPFSLPTGIPLPLVRRHDMVNGWLAMVSDDLTGARHVLGRPSSSEGSERINTWIDAWLAHTHLLLGELAQALTIAERGLSRVENFHIQLLEPLLLRTCVTTCLLTGDTSRALEYHNRLATSPDAFMIQRIPSAISRLEAATLLNDTAAAHRAGTDLSALSASHDFAQPGFWPWTDLWTNHLTTSGQTDSAEALIDATQARITTSGIPSLHARLLASRARLLVQRGDVDPGFAYFDEALGLLSNGSLPLLNAMLLYDYGRIARRVGRRSHADALLAQAEQHFAAMRASAFTEHARRERRASGVGNNPQPAGNLTPQELEIATLVADGASNQEAAQALYLSTKTIEYHLTRVYRKLGIRRRAELPRALEQA